jgi:D-proline reductase (dithiol) PrdB
VPVDSFKFLPRLIAAFYRTVELEPQRPIPWTPLPAPIHECTFGLVTSGGLFHRESQEPFDLARERVEPTWGDPSFRRIPSDIRQEQIGVSHLHVNPAPALEDFNVLLPIQRFRALEEAGEIGALATHHYAFMGYQGFPPDASDWREEYGPRVAEAFLAEGVQCILLTPS